MESLSPAHIAYMQSPITLCVLQAHSALSLYRHVDVQHVRDGQVDLCRRVSLCISCLAVLMSILLVADAIAPHAAGSGQIV